MLYNITHIPENPKEGIMEFPIIDFHAHFPVPDEGYATHWEGEYSSRYGHEKLELLKRQARASDEKWWRTYSFKFAEREIPSVEVQAERWSQEVERYGLEKIVFVTGGGNDTLARVVAMNPQKFIGFAHHDPFQEDAADELRRAVVGLGLRGYKILAPALRGALDSRSLDPLWATAEQLQIPVLIHFGVLGGGGGIAQHVNINPLTLHSVAKGFPGIHFIIPHFSAGYPQELLQLAWVCPNVSVDSSGNNEWVRWMPYPLNLHDLFRKFYETLGPERIIFGTDSEWFPRGFANRYYESQWQVCCEIGMDEEDLHKIFHDNAARLLHLDGS
jgi:predicted TIM-barrel fold metal-dependent hydrolase